MKQTVRASHKKIRWTLIAIVALLALAGLGYVVYNKGRHDGETAKTTSKEPTAQADYSEGGDRPSNNGNSANTGGAVDTKGKPSTPAPDDASTWAKSESGIITVKQPTANATIKSGATLSGSAELNAVQYRLVDEEFGVIAQGTLNTVDGNFAGNLQFTPRGTSGKLVVFNYNKVSGAEENSVTLPVTIQK